MKEVEVKVRNIDKKEIIEKIEKLGAVKNFTGRVIDFRFDTPERRLSKQGKALRIRQKGRYFYLNLKGKKKSIENITGRDEVGVKISNARIMHRMLNELGYIKIFELNKYRTEYKMDEVKFDIDEYVGMPPILEIESDTYATVEKYLGILGIEGEDIGRVYIREILAAKKRVDENKKNNNNVNIENVNKNKNNKYSYDYKDIK
jgi:predicted adenylyl cyclase CyaB